MPPDNTEQARWFTEEVHPHRGALRAYLLRSFPGVRDVDDVVQDSFLRLWAVHASRQIGCARAFLFKIARHRALEVLFSRASAAGVRTIPCRASIRPSRPSRLFSPERGLLPPRLPAPALL